jgi:hypothetical protein
MWAFIYVGHMVILVPCCVIILNSVSTNCRHVDSIYFDLKCFQLKIFFEFFPDFSMSSYYFENIHLKTFFFENNRSRTIFGV